MNPAALLHQGVAILDPVLGPAGFVFVMGDTGIGSGGPYASGSFTRGDTRLELHFRRSLGPVIYHFGDSHIGHGDLMKILGCARDAAVPGYSNDPLSAFHDLRSDLERFGAGFLAGDVAELRQAAQDATEREARHWTGVQAGYEGDGRCREQARAFFRAGNYREALTAFRSVRHPDLLTASEHRMWHIAEDRSPPVTISIRHADPKDAADLAGLLTQLGYPTTPHQMGTRLTGLMEDPQYHTVVAVADDRVVGLAGLGLGRYYERDGRYARLLVLVVDEAAQGIGAGHSLLAAAEAWARQQGAAAMVVNSGHHRTEAHVFYQRHGYESTGIRLVKAL